MSKSGQRSSEPQTASVQPDQGIRLIERQITKARDLLSGRPLTRDAHAAWEATTRSVLVKAFGPVSTNLANVLNVGKSGAVFLNATEEWLEDMRVNDLGTQVVLLEGCVEQLEIDRELAGEPGSGTESVGARRAEATPADSSVVFVVYGRNLAIRDAMFSFLRSIDLKPLEWLKAIEETKKPAPSIGEILEANFSKAQAVVVLMTPDDLACLREDLRGDNEPAYEQDPTGQARPNVLFEAGMAMGRHDDRTVLVEVGPLRPFSDIAGIHVVHLDNSTEKRQELATKLSLAGCPVNTNGTDWHSTGDFEIALEQESIQEKISADATPTALHSLAEQLRAFVKEGAELKQKCLQQSESLPGALTEHWRVRVKSFLEKNFGNGYAKLWDDGGNPKRRFTGITTHAAASGLWEAIQVRVERLEEIEMEVRRGMA